MIFVHNVKWVMLINLLCCFVVLDHSALSWGLEWLCVSIWKLLAELSSLWTTMESAYPQVLITHIFNTLYSIYISKKNICIWKMKP